LGDYTAAENATRSKVAAQILKLWNNDAEIQINY
jgi:hypothetical protein